MVCAREDGEQKARSLPESPIYGKLLVILIFSGCVSICGKSLNQMISYKGPTPPYLPINDKCVSVWISPDRYDRADWCVWIFQRQLFQNLHSYISFLVSLQTLHRGITQGKTEVRYRRQLWGCRLSWWEVRSRGEKKMSLMLNLRL